MYLLIKIIVFLTFGTRQVLFLVTFYFRGKNTSILKYIDIISKCCLLSTTSLILSAVWMQAAQYYTINCNQWGAFSLMTDTWREVGHMAFGHTVMAHNVRVKQSAALALVDATEGFWVEVLNTHTHTSTGIFFSAN